MATVIDSPTRFGYEKRTFVSSIRWTAIFGGLVAGLGSYIVLALFGVAVGLTAIDPQEAEPVGAVPVGTGIWSGISMLISSFIGGFVAARMSGLARAGDGLLHGFVTWGATTLLFAYLATSAVSSILGGTLGLAGQALQGAAGAATSGQAQGMGDSLEKLLTGSSQANINPQDVTALRERLKAGDRQGAVDLMVNQMGFQPDRANQVADQAMKVVGPGAGEKVEQVAEKTVSSLAAVSWWLFIGMALSIAAALWGGVTGIRPNSRRTLGDHKSERREVLESGMHSSTSAAHSTTGMSSSGIIGRS